MALPQRVSRLIQAALLIESGRLHGKVASVVERWAILVLEHVPRSQFIFLGLPLLTD